VIVAMWWFRPLWIDVNPEIAGKGESALNFEGVLVRVSHRLASTAFKEIRSMIR
jgi:hypothetical protein